MIVDDIKASLSDMMHHTITKLFTLFPGFTHFNKILLISIICRTLIHLTITQLSVMFWKNSSKFEFVPDNESLLWAYNAAEIIDKAAVNLVGYNALLYIFVTIIIALSISLILLSLDHISRKDLAPNRRIHFSVLFDHNIRRVFRSQRKDSLNTIMYGARAALSSHCERPPVLMFLATQLSYSTALALSQRVAQAFLVAQGSDISSEVLHEVIIKGSEYQALEDYWDFYRGLARRLAQQKVAIVADFQRVHPQIALVLSNLADDVFSPYPKAMILLLVDMDNYFTNRELETRSPMEMAESFTSHIMSGFLDQETVADLQRTICGRPAYIDSDQQVELL